MTTVITVEARMRSTRLPGKVLAPVHGEPMLARMIERLERVRLADGIVVATTVDPVDDSIADLAAHLGVGCHRGSEEDVLQRVLDAAVGADADVIVETTADCPLIDPGVIDQLIDSYFTNRVDYCSNVLASTYPRGLDAQVFSRAVLADAASRTADPADREHVSLYIYEHPDRYRLMNLGSGLPGWAAELRLTVDTPSDYRLVNAIYQELYPNNPLFGLADILDLLERRPDLKEVNQHVRQKAVR